MSRRIWKVQRVEPGAQSPHVSVHLDEGIAMAEVASALRELVERLKYVAFEEAARAGDDEFVYQASRAIEEIEAALDKGRAYIAFELWRDFLSKSERVLARPVEVGDVLLSWTEA